MNLRFQKMNPAGNTTILVTDPAPLPRTMHMKLSRTLISPRFLAAEQAGFLEPPEDPRAAVRLQMMGGEFCGNASRAVAAYLQDLGGPGVAAVDRRDWPGGVPARADQCWSVLLEASGSPDLLQAHTAKLAESLWWAAVTVPLPESLEERSLSFRGETMPATLVKLPGIEHLVVEMPESAPEELAPADADLYTTARQQGCFSRDADARGIMMLYHNENDTQLRMTPLVAVGDDDPLREGSCGSGSVAAAAYLATRRETSIADLSIVQPEGTLTVSIGYHQGRFHNAVISGTVERVAAGTVYVPDNLL